MRRDNQYKTYNDDVLRILGELNLLNMTWFYRQGLLNIKNGVKPSGLTGTEFRYLRRRGLVDVQNVPQTRVVTPFGDNLLSNMTEKRQQLVAELIKFVFEFFFVGRVTPFQ